MQVVLPGDVIALDARDGLPVQYKLGPGVISSAGAAREPENLVATKAGLLGYEVKETTKAGRVVSYWVEARSKRYIPAVGEPVIGTVVARHAEGYRVDIGAAHMATLDALAFEGATKRSKPNLKVGALVYAKVSLAHAFAEPEIICVDQVSQKAQGLGELTGGMQVRSLALQACRGMLSSSHPLLPSFGARFPFECAIGVNGRVWVKSSSPEHTVELARALRGA